MNTNLLQPRAIFLYSIPETKKKEMESKNFNYNLFIDKIGSIEGVEIHELNKEFFSFSHNAQLLIILSEYLESEDALLLNDNSLLPLNELITMISTSCSNAEVIDLAFCFSGKIHDKLKEHTSALVNTNNNYTQIEVRLQLYSLLLKFKLWDLGRDNYKESYDFVLGKLQDKQDKRSLQELGQLPEGTKLGTMSTSAAPLEAVRNSTFHVKAYIFADGEEADIIAEIDKNKYQHKIRRNLKLNDGERISWDLSFDTDPETYENLNKHILGAGSHSEIWNSEKLRIEYTFKCFVKPEFTLNGFNGVLKTTIGDKEPETWSFSFNVEVVPYYHAELKQQFIEKNEDITSKDDIIIPCDEVQRKCQRMEITDFPAYIDKKIKDAQKIEMYVSRIIQEDYNYLKKNIERKIEENKNIVTEKYSEVSYYEMERLYILDKRLEMMEKLRDIRSLIRQKKEKEMLCRETREKISEFAGEIFAIIKDDKVDYEIYDKCLKHIYTNEKGKHRGEAFDFFSDPSNENLRGEFNGLAISLAMDDLKLNDIYQFMKYTKGEYDFVDMNNKKEKIPKANFDIEKNSRYVSERIVIYIERLLDDKSVEGYLDQYLHSERGKSSVFAYYLRELFTKRKK